MADPIPETATRAEALATLPPLAADDPRRELLAKELAYWSECFWKNEEAGERRIRYYVSLLTAVMAGLAGLYEYMLKDGGGAEAAVDVLRRVAVPALAGLLLLGFITFLRMLRRNVVTDSYKEWADTLRMRLMGHDEFGAIYRPVLEFKRPWWREGGGRSLLNGGLAVTMMSLNAFVLATLAGILAYPDSGDDAWIVAVVVFAAGFYLQFALARKLESAEKGELTTRWKTRTTRLGWPFSP